MGGRSGKIVCRQGCEVIDTRAVPSHPPDMRSVLALGASALAGLAAMIASLDGDADIVPFFVGLTFLGGVQAWAAQPPFTGMRHLVARAIALVWLLAAVWVGVLLVMLVTVWEAARPVGPTPVAEATYLGLSATAYHLVGLYGGLVLAMLAAFGRRGWFERVFRSARARAETP